MTANRQLIELPVAVAGICGSDIQKMDEADIRGLGHEAVCETAPGQYAAISPLWGCQECPSCMDGAEMHCPDISALGRTTVGAFSGMVEVPERSVYPIDSAHKDVAVLADPYAVIRHGFTKLRPTGGPVAIIGDGVLAQLSLTHILLNEYRAQDCTIITKTNERAEQLLDRYGQLARQRGIGLQVVTAGLTLDATFDTVVETVGRGQDETLAQSITLARPLGQIVMFGVYPVGYTAATPIRQLLYKEVSLVGANSFASTEFGDAIRSIGQHAPVFRQLLGASFDRAELDAAFMAASRKPSTELPNKITVTY